MRSPEERVLKTILRPLDRNIRLGRYQPILGSPLSELNPQEKIKGRLDRTGNHDRTERKNGEPGSLYRVGLSGEQQHMVGIAGARVMIAINNDAKSPIFEQVDYGIVDDCREFLPLLIQKIKAYQEKKFGPQNL